MKCKNVECENETEGKRVYCSLTCRNIFVNKYLRNYDKVSDNFKQKKKEKEKEYLKNVKRCKFCNKDILYDTRENDYCNHSCSASYSNKKRAVKNNCINCNNEINKNRKFCSSRCQSQNKRSIIFEKIKNGDITFGERNYKNYLIYTFGEKCMECGWDKVHLKTGKVPIQLEHVDGNSSNNSLENLKLLCPNCHSLTPTYGSLNKGRGIRNRKR